MYSPFFIPQHGGKRPAVQPQTVDSEVLYGYLPFCFPPARTDGRGKQKFLTEMQIESQLSLCITEENREMPQTGLTFREISITIRSNFTCTDIGSDKWPECFYRDACPSHDYW